MTNRLRAALQALGLATSGEAGTHVSEQLGMPVTASCLIRSLRRITIAPPLAVRIVGIDDWSATRSRMYSCKDSRKEDLTWDSALSALPG